MPTEIERFFTLSYWFNGTPSGPSIGVAVVIALFAVMTFASLIVWLKRRRLFPGQRIKTRLAARYGPWLFGIASFGLVSSVLAAVDFPIFSARIVWLAAGIWFIAIVGYLAWFMIRRYPQEARRLAREEALRPYLPKPGMKKRANKRRR